VNILQGLLWLGVYLGLVLAPVVLLLFVPTPPGGGFWWDLAIGLGFAGLVMMSMQFLLTARFRRATAPFGIDLVYYLHRYLAYALLAIVLAHPILLLLLNPALRPYLNPLRAPWEMTAGTVSLLLLLLIVALSAGRKALRVPYEAWRVTHLLLSIAAVGLALLHAMVAGTFTQLGPVRALWAAIGISLLLVVVRVRVLRPWSLRREPWRVESVEREPGRSWRLTLAPEGHGGFPFLPGQFAWVSVGDSPFLMREHPFSISSAPSWDGRLEFTIKELGDFTGGIGSTSIGTRAYVDGPYGSFSIDRHPEAPGYVFIGGGIGVAPMVGMLRALADRGDRRPHLLLSAHGEWNSIPLREEMAALRDRLELQVVQFLEEPPLEWEGAQGRITRERLDEVLPGNRREVVYFICGPLPMIRAVEGQLRELGIPGSRVHTELFDLV